jgi:solute:Na+ symporter, SSS family
LNIYVLFLGFYLIALVFIGFIGVRKVSTQEDFSVAGRSLNTFVLFGTMLATWIGTGSIFGNAEKAYEVGIAAFIIPTGALVGIAILSLLAARARGLEQITIQDLLEKRYNAAARVFGVVALVLAYLTIVSYQYRAAGAVLNLVYPEISYNSAVILSAAFIIIYTSVAGMVSIARIGLIQGITIIVGILVTLPVFFYRAGGLDGMSEALQSSHFDFFGPIGFIEALGLMLPAMLLVLGDANMYQRFFSARNAGTARKAILWTLGGVTVMEMAIIATAWIASALEPGLEIPGRVIAYAARDFLPPILGAFLLTTIMAIVLSTAGSYLLSPSTALVRDIYQRFLNPGASERSLVILLRVAVVGTGIISFWLATLSEEFLSVALLAYTIYGAAITPALIASFFWRRATGKGAVASIVSGTLVTLLWHWLGPASVDAVLPAIAVSILALILVSLLDSPPPNEKVEPFFK